MDENDAKLWGARVTYWVLSTIDCTILGKFIGGLFGTKSSHSLPWIILFVIVTVGAIYFWLLYRHYRRVRKQGGGHKTPEQIEIETLAAYGASQKPTQPVPAQPTPTQPILPQQPVPAQPTPPQPPPENINWHS
jgi:hypothetical protein